MVCFARMSFQLSDCDPPICFSAPRGAWASLAATVVSFLCSPAGLFALITKFSRLNAYCSERCNVLGAPPPGRHVRCSYIWPIEAHWVYPTVQAAPLSAAYGWALAWGAAPRSLTAQ